MSINTLANAAAARRTDISPLGQVPVGFEEIAVAATTVPTTDNLAPSRPRASIDTALNVLFGYIPTEIVTLYVAVMATLQKGEGITAPEWAAFWGFLTATPVVVWLVFAAKLKTAGKALPTPFSTWPVWEMLAATVAYAAWAFALPHSPFSVFAWYSSALSGVGVLLASTGLGLIAPFFQRPLATQ